MAVVTVLASCDKRYAYDNYRSVDVDGWNRSDTLDFNVGKVPAGVYDMSIGFRATGDYPYKELGFDITCTVYSKVKKHDASADSLTFKSIHKRVKCSVFDDEGRMTGKSGISSDDFNYRFDEISVRQGDSVVVSMTHGMNQEVMPGIMQVGLQLEPVGR